MLGASRDAPSYHALVGSMNSTATQYSAYISQSAGVNKEFNGLEDGITMLFESFLKKNNSQLPRHVSFIYLMLSKVKSFNCELFLIFLCILK